MEIEIEIEIEIDIEILERDIEDLGKSESDAPIIYWRFEIYLRKLGCGA